MSHRGFNAKVHNWHSGHPTDYAGKQTQFLASSHNLTQVIAKPTFGLNSNSPSLPDLIFLNKPHLVQSCVVLPPFADHCPTVVQLQLRGVPKSKPTSHYNWDYEKANFSKLRTELSKTDWSTVISSKNVDVAISH